MSVKGPLLIIGASGRAAAASAIRKGYVPQVIDLFADADTQRLAPTLRCELKDYPQGFIALAETLPPMPWMYTGGLENHPEVVRAISQRHSLSGNPPEVLKRVRDPFELGELVCKHGAKSPTSHRVHPTCHRVYPGGSPRLLRKPYRSAGGFGITFNSENSDDHYFQEFIEGTPVSAVYERMHLLGVSRQLIGEDWLHARPFHYCGNISLSEAEYPCTEVFEHLRRKLFNEFDLRGDWGLDAIWNDEGLRIIELNPRYCASEELTHYGHDGEAVGKAIYYAQTQVTVPRAGPWLSALDHCNDFDYFPRYADIPHAGTVIEPGHPVMTIFAKAATTADCLLKLKLCAAKLDRLFGVTP